MSASANQIVVYQPNETIRLNVRIVKAMQTGLTGFTGLEAA